jgi:positive regulator of sigma E activity
MNDQFTLAIMALGALLWMVMGRKPIWKAVIYFVLGAIGFMLINMIQQRSELWGLREWSLLIAGLSCLLFVTFGEEILKLLRK